MVECEKQTLPANAAQEDLRGDAPPVLRVCFVCTGNTCRSPMAAAVANALAAKEWERMGGLKTEAWSAGLYAAEGEPISPNAVAALENFGVAAVAGKDYHTHTAHTLRAEDAERFDLLIGLSGGHCMELLMRFPQLAQRIVGMPEPIPDPYGGDLSVYTQCLEEIEKGVRTLLFSSHEEGDGA